MQFWRLSPSLKETIYVEVLNTVYKLSVGAIWLRAGGIPERRSGFNGVLYFNLYNNHFICTKDIS